MNFLFTGSFELESHEGPKWRSRIHYKVETEVIEAENTKVNVIFHLIYAIFTNITVEYW